MLRKIFPLLLFLSSNIFAQDQIADFISVMPLDRTTDFIIPSSHSFQKIIEYGDTMTDGTVMRSWIDFTGYMGIEGSSKNGYLCINNELRPGGADILDISIDNEEGIWRTIASESLDFSAVGGTASNCSGTITPWNTMFSCEETISKKDQNQDGYYDTGWCVEIDPINKVVIDKRWALGCIQHENIAIHENHRTIYQGSDSEPGYLYKFVADTAQNLGSGKLFVYKGAKNGTGEWLQLTNTTPEERNTTLDQSGNLGATVFNGVEDVEMGPDGMVYFSVKKEGKVYRFLDSDPITGTTIPKMEVFVGGKKYTIKWNGGNKKEPWGYGNDNLAFDGDGNLWVLQDGTENFIWVVEKGHTQSNPKVKLFGRTPLGSEPTGISFSPNFRYLFMSIQHPDTNNIATIQIDAAGNEIGFNKDISLVIALNKYLGDPILSNSNIEAINSFEIYPNPSHGEFELKMNQSFNEVDVFIVNLFGETIFQEKFSGNKKIRIKLKDRPSGVYLLSLYSKGILIDTREFIID